MPSYGQAPAPEKKISAASSNSESATVRIHTAQRINGVDVLFAANGQTWAVLLVPSCGCRPVRSYRRSCGVGFFSFQNLLAAKPKNAMVQCSNSRAAKTCPRRAAKIL
jgi:hypothetical protein